MSFCEALAILLLSLVSPSFSRDSRRILEVERFPEGVAVAGESEQFQLLHYDLVGCGYYFLNRTDIAFFSYDETQRSCVGYKHVTELVRGYGGLQTFYINRKDTPWRDQIECLKGWTRFEDRCYQMLLIELDDEKTPEEVTDMVFHDCSRRSGVASAQAVSIHKGPSGGEPHDVVISMTCDFHRNPKSLHKIFSKKPMAEELSTACIVADSKNFTAGIGLIAPFNRTTFGADTFRWADGTPVDFTAWDKELDQPDNTRGTNEFLTVIFYDGTWHDYSRFDNPRFWCYYNMTLTL
uniref:C-type lectin domain-containing protein n=1 Tax=Steinernema glaseri TaxID=37863 RepID=A0A1I7Z6A8_9BILA